jgi:hypothetical protein
MSAIFALTVSVALAEKLDRRLATAKTVWVEPVDPLDDDMPVSKCVAARLTEHVPLTLAESKPVADLVLRVSAHLPSATARYALGALGGSPSVHMYAVLPNGTALWDDGGKFRRANMKNNVVTATDVASSIECGLADDILEHLRDAMKQARNANK